MDIHKNARLTFLSREALAQSVLLQGRSFSSAAAAFRVSPKTAAKWVRRYQQLGRSGFQDRSSRPHRSPRRTRSELVQAVAGLRRQRWTGCRIAHSLGLSRATVSRILRRLHLNRIRDLEPAPVVLRYEHAAPGDLLHLDIKRLVRIGRVGHRITGDRRSRLKGVGYEFVHVAIDDHSRIAFSQILPDQKHSSAVAFLRAAVAYYAGLGIAIRRILTDNGPCYDSLAFRQASGQLHLLHSFTRPYRPQTNGKAERFIQTALREWAYARAYESSAQRAQQLPCWLHQYNWHRPHASLNSASPITRSGLDRNNLLSHHN